MLCQDAHVAIQESLDVRLSASTQRALDAHLETCEACRAYQAGMGALTIRLTTLAAPEAAPEALMRNLGLVPAPRRRMRRAWLPAGIAAAAALLVAVGLGHYRSAVPLANASQASRRMPAMTASLGTGADAGQEILDWFGPEPDSEDQESDASL